MLLEPKHDPALVAHRKERCEIFSKEKAKSEAYLFLGSSIIEFFSLKKFLGQDLALVNHGIAGLSAHWMAEHVAEVLGQVSAQKIFLLIGTNDIGMGYSVQETAAAIESILNELRAYSIASQLYLVSVLPVNESADYQARVKVRRNSLIQALNEKLAQFPAVTYINAYSALVNQEGQLDPALTTDGLHLSQSGYDLLASVLKDYL